MIRYIVVRPDQVKSYTVVHDMPNERNGWSIATEVITRKGTKYGRVLEESNGNLRHARFNSQADAAAAIPKINLPSV